jgi:phosphatidate cytidylyltransferase
MESGGRRRRDRGRRKGRRGETPDPIFNAREEEPDLELFVEEPPAPAPQPRQRRGLSGETLKRVLVAIPWIAFAIVITALGGVVFTLAMVGLGLIGLREYFQMSELTRPLQAAGFVAVPAIVIAAHYGSSYQVLMLLTVSFPVMFALAVGRDNRDGITISMGSTLFGIVWIGVPLVHAVLLRDLPDHGGALLIDVLVGTFVTDTAAYATGRLFGSHRITPRLSPNKTLEGMIGGFVIGTMAFWFAGLYQDWLPGFDALVMGACVAAIAPVGDLFESMVKRDLGIKDTGNIFGPHGGLLDRLDAVLFTIVVGYYLSVAFVY